METAEGSKTVNASAQNIMQVLIDFEGYPDWTDVKATKVEKTDQQGRATEVWYEVSQFGITAKYTLANYAAREPDLLDMLKRTAPTQSKEAEPVLKEVIHAAETVNVTALHREQLAAVEELKRKGPGYKRDLSTWGQVGVGALALGCVAAAALGQIEVGIPCVIGGSVSSGALSLWEKQKD